MSNNEIDKFAAMEALDESQIVEEIKGHVIEQFFYEFTQGGKQVTGISYSGLKWVANKMAHHGEAITIEDIRFEDFPDQVDVIAKARNVATGVTMFGISSCPKMMTLKDGTQKPDPFARQKALSKAQRNAIRNFIPEIAIQEGYKEWKKQGSIEKVFAGRLDGQTK